MITVYFAFNPSRVGSIYIQDTNFVITVSRDVLVPNSARPSVATVLIIKLEMFSSKFIWL